MGGAMEAPLLREPARFKELLDLQRRRDVHHPGVTFFLNQLMNTLQIIFGALTGRWWRGHVAPINHNNRRWRKRGSLRAEPRNCLSPTQSAPLKSLNVCIQ